MLVVNHYLGGEEVIRGKRFLRERGQSFALIAMDVFFLMSVQGIATSNKDITVPNSSNKGMHGISWFKFISHIRKLQCRKASVLFTTTCAFGMLVNALQSAGIIGMITVEWPVDLKSFFSYFQATQILLWSGVPFSPVKEALVRKSALLCAMGD